MDQETLVEAEIEDGRRLLERLVERPFGTFRLTFSAPVTGPLCLGYASHYGLGLFLPDAN